MLLLKTNCKKILRITMSETIVSTPPKTSLGLLTYEDYLTFPDGDGIKKEIIEGELFMSPAPSIKHQLISRELAFLLHNYIKQNDLGELFFAPCDVVFSNINVMQPDILFISKNNFQILTELNIQGAPDLIVEISSPSSRDTDRIYKKNVYQKFGVKEYWIVDPNEEIVEIWVLKDKNFQLNCRASNDQKIDSQLLKGFQIDLHLIFKNV